MPKHVCRVVKIRCMLKLYVRWSDYFRFGLVFIKKNNQTEFFKKTRTETGSNRPVSVRFGFLEQKPVQTGLTWFFWFGSATSVFSSLTRFFRFVSVFLGLGSIRFFRFQAYKTETEPVSFFKILISFFYGSVFSIIFFQFSRFNRFFDFFAHPYMHDMSTINY
jgi:hypothetical protein